MYRKMFTGMICLMFLGIFFVPKGRADESDKKTIVTVKESIQVPGKVLPAGTYVLKLLDSNHPTLVAIFNADETHLITTVQGISDSRLETLQRRNNEVRPRLSHLALHTAPGASRVRSDESYATSLAETPPLEPRSSIPQPRPFQHLPAPFE